MLKGLFTVDGKPFFSIGGQVNNSSAYDAEGFNYALDAAEEMGMNTVAAPIYWEELEPECGRYSFAQTEMVISEAEKRGLKLVLLWFGTWKNGTSRYIPEWMKRDTGTYRTCVGKAGVKTAILSPHCGQTRQKDAQAFAALMEYVEGRNGKGTVLAVQVENEPGFLGTPRDYGAEAEALFNGPVPEEVLKWLDTLESGAVYESVRAAQACGEALQKCRKGETAHGTDCGEASGVSGWRATFGFDAEEMFSAYYVAKYIDSVAAEGKKKSALPLYVNVWLREHQFRVPGMDFPSGGATSLTLDLWKKFAPQIDCICPDVYFNDFEGYMRQCAAYHREDNLLYIPESRLTGLHGKHLLTALERYELTSVHCFGIDSIHDRSGALLPECRDYRDTVTVLRSMKPLIEAYQGTGRLYAVAQYEGMDHQFFDFGDYHGKVVFLNNNADEPYIHLDSHHYEPDHIGPDGMGLIVYEGNGSFYLAGRGFKLLLVKKTDAAEMSDSLWAFRFLSMRNIPYLRVDEGSLSEDGKFKAVRRRSGDETDTGLWVEPDVGVVHAVLL